MTEQMLRQYTVLVEYLGATLGPDYEVVLHEILPETSRVAAIANGTISGRDVGAPITNAALRMIMQKQYETSDYNLNYTGQLANGKTIRSSTMFIKDGGKLVGLLCINFDDSRYLAASENVLRLCHPDIFIDDHIAPQQAEPGDPFPRAVPATTESFHNSIDAVAGDAVGRELIRLGVTADRLTPDERMQIIASLENGGIFLLKGAVKDVADALHCSQASVYRYLSQIKKDDSNSASE